MREGVNIKEEYHRGDKISVIEFSQVKGYASLKAIGAFYGMSKSSAERKLHDLQKSYDIDVINWEEGTRVTRLVDFAAFHKAVWETSEAANR